MRSATVRLGGVAILGALLLRLLDQYAIDGAVAHRAMQSISALLIVFALWTTKGFLNAKGFAKADVPILAVIAALIVVAVLTLFGGSGAGGMGPLLIATNVIVLLMVASWLWFGLRSLDFGMSDGPTWKAIGILYIVAMGGLTVAVLLRLLAIAMPGGAGGLGAIVGILGVAGGLALLAAAIAHAVGLIQGASGM